MLTPAERREKIKAVIRVSSGNFLEMYDFFVFGYYASAIGQAFFPSTDEFASLMQSLMTFALAFLMRPIGAIVLGSYVDRYGRRRGLLLTLALMSVGTASIALVPGLCDHRLFRAAAAGARAADPGVLGRRRAGRGVGVSVGNRHAGEQGVLCGLAIRQPADRGDLRGAGGRGAERAVFARADGGLGLAHSDADRLHDHSADLPAAPVAAGNRGVRRPHASPVAARNLRLDDRKLAAS